LENTEENRENIWKKDKLNSEMIGKYGRKVS
jgi:hypothetical protein